jgi:hypothetical protein
VRLQPFDNLCWDALISTDEFKTSSDKQQYLLSALSVTEADIKEISVITSKQSLDALW